MSLRLLALWALMFAAGCGRSAALVVVTVDDDPGQGLKVPLDVDGLEVRVTDLQGRVGLEHAFVLDESHQFPNSLALDSPTPTGEATVAVSATLRGARVASGRSPVKFVLGEVQQITLLLFR